MLSCNMTVNVFTDRVRWGGDTFTIQLGDIKMGERDKKGPILCQGSSWS